MNIKFHRKDFKFEDKTKGSQYISNQELILL